MKWSWKIGSVAGIGIHLHVTFLILLAWIGLSHYLLRRNWQDAWEGVGFILCLFGIVVLHELGHALTAKRYGIRTRDITLLPIGGVARMERIPEDPKQELMIALAGPAVNVLIAGLLFVVIAAAGAIGSLSQVKLLGGDLVTKLLWVNVWLALFNLLPAFPMDGGRVLRAVLAMRMDYVGATNIAEHVGKAMACVFGFIGLFTNPFLLLIALFVWMGAAQESSQVRMKHALEGIPVKQVMITEFRALAPQESLGAAVDHILAGWQQDFPVLEGDQVVGVLTRADLLKGLAGRGQKATVGESMQRRIKKADEAEMVEHVLARLENDDCRTVPVMRHDQLVGMLTMENVGEFLMVQAALRGKLAGTGRTSFAFATKTP